MPYVLKEIEADADQSVSTGFSGESERLQKKLKVINIFMVVLVLLTALILQVFNHYYHVTLTTSVIPELTVAGFLIYSIRRIRHTI